MPPIKTMLEFAFDAFLAIIIAATLAWLVWAVLGEFFGPLAKPLRRALKTIGNSRTRQQQAQIDALREDLWQMGDYMRERLASLDAQLPAHLRETKPPPKVMTALRDAQMRLEASQPRDPHT